MLFEFTYNDRIFYDTLYIDRCFFIYQSVGRTDFYNMSAYLSITDQG